jgi:DNA-binding transcriptional ArsR family regulator
MSTLTRETTFRKLRRDAFVFTALGDHTRLAVLMKLSGGTPLSIASLTRGSKLTRQAVTKHLRVLEGAGLVRGVRRGREILFELKPEPLEDARRSLENISRQWDEALARLKAFVEQ